MSDKIQPENVRPFACTNCPDKQRFHDEVRFAGTLNNVEGAVHLRISPELNELVAGWHDETRDAFLRAITPQELAVGCDGPTEKKTLFGKRLRCGAVTCRVVGRES